MEQSKIPKLWIESIELKAEHEAALQFDPVHYPSQNRACQICYRNGAIEYATMIVDCNRLNTVLEEKNISLSEENTALKAKCERYEKALKEISGHAGQLIPPKHEMIAIANEALAWDGEKEVDNG
jgi:hypothetical protein